MNETNDKKIEDLLRGHYASLEAQTKVPELTSVRKIPRSTFRLSEFAAACALFVMVVGVYPASIQTRQASPELIRIVTVLTDERAIESAGQFGQRIIEDLQQHFGAERNEKSERSIR